MAERQPKPSGRHSRATVHWMPAEGLGEWVRAEAKRRTVATGRRVTVSHVVNEAVGRARQAADGTPPPPQPRMGRPPRAAATAGRDRRAAELRALAANAVALRENQDTEGDGR